MDTLEKLKILSSAAKYDVCSATGCGPSSSGTARPSPNSGVCHSFTPDGRCISLFKVLQTNSCQKDCFYCPNRAQRDVPRSAFSPDELAGVFLEFYRRNYVEGLFLSSGVLHNSGHTMEQMIKTVEILRYKHRFTGYIHLKVLPGTGFDYIQRAAQLASRVSINIEAPSGERLKRLSKLKNFHEEIITRMHWVNQLARDGNLPAGHTSQFIVGAAGESDAEILKTTVRLYKTVNLRRAYFSAFQPIAGTPLEGNSPVPVLREHRLYQSDFLIRQYGFHIDEIYFNRNGQLPLDLDPKMSFALNNPGLYPLEINKASYRELLRVPGIGPVSAKRIVAARKNFRLTSLEELKNIGVVVKKASPFIQLNGRYRESYKLVKQLELWSDCFDSNSQFDALIPFEGSHAFQAV